MKKLIGALLVLAMMLSIVPAQAARGYRSLWIEGEDAVVISGQWTAVSDGNASGKKIMQLDTTKEEPHEITLSFTLSYDGEYDIFSLGTPNADWTSTRKWKLNDEEYSADRSTNLGNGYTTAGGRNVSMSWQKLTTVNLKKGVNTINCYAEKKRPAFNDFCLQMIDAIAIVPTEWNWAPNGTQVRPYDSTKIKMNVASGKASKKELQREEAFDIDIEYRLGAKADGMPKLFAEITKDGAKVLRTLHTPTVPLKSWGVGMIQNEKFSLKIPFDLPDGKYEIRAGIADLKLENGEESALVDTIIVGNAKNGEVAPVTADFSNIKIPDSIQKGVPVEVSADFELNRAIGKEAKPYLAIWKDGLLYDVLEGNKAISEEEKTFAFEATMESDMPAGDYEATVGIHYVHTNTESKRTVKVSGGDSLRIKYHKPMSFGHYYSKKTGREQFWYINQNSTAIWNGEPYIPFGGMLVSDYIYNYKEGDDAGNKKRFLQDVADLEEIRASGVNDLYINPVRAGDSVPAYAWEYFLDYLESEGWYYGIQSNVSNGGNTAEVYYPRAVESLGRFEVKNVTSSGEVTYTRAKSFAASISDVRSAVYVVINDESNNIVDSGICELNFDADGNVEFKANVTLESEQSHTVYFTPRVYGSTAQAKNYWKNPERIYNAIEKFAKGLNFGDNFRVSVDVQGNEMGFYNQFESARIADEEFNELFKGWLEAKYKTVSALNAKWKTNPALTSFNEAVRLIPVYTSSKDENNDSYSIFVDNETGSAYAVDTHTGVAWNDYLDARDDEYLKFNNKSADAFKAHSNIPVVYKHSSVNRRYFINKDTVGGIDGMGSETYGHTVKVQSGAAQTASMVEQMTRTGLKLITETNTEENITAKYNSNQWSYPSEEDMFERFGGMLAGGTKGIYDFLLKDDPDMSGMLGKTYSWKVNKDTIAWAKNFNDMLEKNIDKYANQKGDDEIFYIYPQFKNWWYNPTERGAVQLLDDELRTSFLRTKEGAGNFVSPTDSLAVDSRLIFINIQDGPYSNIHGPELSKLLQNQPEDKRICVLGHRNDIGTIPEVDKYFSNEKVVIDEETKETVQILIPTSTSEVLKTTEDGKPWALRDGELYIVASDKIIHVSETKGHIKYVDELGVTDVRALSKKTGTTEAAVNDGFTDMKGHWAEDDVNYMKKQGIAQGVGDGKFSPDTDITVAEFVALITRIMGYRATGAESDKWYGEVMAQAEANGLLTEAMKSNPERVIKREEMAYVAANALGKADSEFDLASYTDHADISEEMKSAVAAAAELELVYGMEDGSFRPVDNSTRAQATVIAKRIMLKK